MAIDCAQINRQYEKLISLWDEFKVGYLNLGANTTKRRLIDEIKPGIEAVLREFNTGIPLKQKVWSNIKHISRMMQFAVAPEDFLTVGDDGVLKFIKNDQRMLMLSLLAELHGLLTHPDNQITSLEVPKCDQNFEFILKILDSPNCRIKKIRLLPKFFSPDELLYFAEFNNESRSFDELEVINDGVSIKSSKFIVDLLKYNQANKLRAIKTGEIKYSIINFLITVIRNQDNFHLNEFEATIDKSSYSFSMQKVNEFLDLAAQKGIKASVHFIETEPVK